MAGNVTSDWDAIWAQVADVPPVAYQLKLRLADRWIRFHSLPDAKRYAETPAEEQEVMTRARTVILDLAGGRQDCVLITALWGEPDERPALLPEQAFVHTHAKAWTEVSLPGDGTMHIWASHEPALPSLIEPLIERSADERLMHAMVVLPHQHVVVHPYDGGLDVILPTTSQRDEVAARYDAWRSRHELGL